MTTYAKGFPSDSDRCFEQVIDCPRCDGGKWAPTFGADGRVLRWSSGEAIIEAAGEHAGPCPTCAGSKRVMARIEVVSP